MSTDSLLENELNELLRSEGPAANEVWDLLAAYPGLPQRLWDRIVIPPDGQWAGHWVWTGYTASNGRPQFQLDGRKRRNVRALMWRLLREPVPAGHFVVNTCGVDLCVRPDCCKLVTPAEEGLLRRQPQCNMGHPLSGENLLESCGKRLCRTCRRDNRREARTNARRR